MRAGSPVRAAVPFLFLISGATGLVYEVVWTRAFSLVFGATALAVSSVLAAYMAGLAIGSRVVGGWIDRRGEELRTYGVLEIGVGAAAVALLPALDVVQRLFVAIYRGAHPAFWAMSLIRFAFSFVLLIIPTAFMGGTLPVLVRWWTRSKDDVARSLGRLYAINTLGAMAGCAIGGFWLIETFGMRQTIFLTAAVNGLVGATALTLGLRRRREGAAAPVSEGSPVSRGSRAGEVAPTSEAASAADAPTAAAEGSRERLALLAIGVSGFLALAYEVAWTRVLLYVLSASIHAFTIMLTTFLAGLALGSFALAGRVERMRHGFRLFGLLEIGIGAAALGTILLLAHYPALHGALLVAFRVHGWGDLVRVKFVEAALVVFLPTLLLGMTFPLVSQLYARDLPQLGRRIGSIVAVNTAGAVVGSFAAGFLLIPWLGTQGTIVLLAVANAALGGALLLAEGGAGGLPRAGAFAPAVLLVALSFLLPKNAFLPVFGMNIPHSKVVYAREGITGTVTIHETPSSIEGQPGIRVLSINGADVAGTSFMLRTTQKLQAHIPLLLHPDPRQVLQVGLGSGETAHSILMHPIERLVGCDISPEVIQAGGYFEDINRSVYADPRLTIVIEDAKNYIACTDQTFDLILNDSVHPIFRGSADLYAREYFEACKSRLRPGGMMSSWFPIGLLAEDDLLMLLHTFHDVFPTSTVWIATNAMTRNALLLGWKDASRPEVDLRRIVRIFRTNAAIAQDLAEVGLGTVPALLDAFQLDPDAIDELTSGARINTYDRPYLEFSAPKVLARGDQILWARNFATITSRRRPIFPYLVNVGTDAESQARWRERFDVRERASSAIIRGLQSDLEGRTDLAQAAYQEALDVLPGDPLASGLVGRGGMLRESVEKRVAAGTATPEEYILLAKWKHEAGERDEAVALLRKAIEMRPDGVRAHLEIVPLLLEAKDVAGARAEIERAIEVDPRMPETYAVRGRIKAIGGDAAGAEADLTRAIQGGASIPWAELLLGKLLKERGRTDEARAHWRAAIDLAPDSPFAAEAKQLLGE
ncbi:MAG: fused MFS/spermidine synthase [bacterium]